MTYLLNSLPQHLLIFLIVFTPLAYGTVHVWAFSIMEFLTLTTLALVMIKNIFQPQGVQWVRTPINIVVLIFISYLFLQLVPLPSQWINYFSPKTFQVYERLNVSFLPWPIEDWKTLSLNTHKSRTDLLKILAYFSIFFCIVNQVRTRKQINQILVAIICVGIFEALYGFGLRASGDQKFWWSDEVSKFPDRISGTYINPAHLAGYLMTIILLTVGFVFSFGTRVRRNQNSEKRNWRQALSHLWNKENKFNKQILLIYAIAIMLLGLFLTASRNGMVSFSVGMAVIIAFAAHKMKLRIIGFWVSAIIVFILLFGWSLKNETVKHVFDRYQTLVSENLTQEGRMNLYQSSSEIVKDFPVTGTGLGTYVDVYPKYQHENIKDLYFTHAHNDWLELMIELGGIGFLLALLILLFYFFIFIRLLRKRKDPYVIGISLGVLGSSAGLLTSCLFDFNLHIPANAFLLSVILGVGYVTVYNETDGKSEISNLRLRSMKMGLWARCLLVGFLGGLLYLYGQEVAHRFWGEMECPTQINTVFKFDPNPSIKKIKKVLAYEPDNSECLVKLIPRYSENKKRAPRRFFGRLFADQIITTLERAIVLNPMQANYYQMLGREFFYKSLVDLANWNDLMDKGNWAFQNAVYFNPRKYETNFKIAGILFSRSNGKGTFGTLRNGPIWIEGKSGQALQFDGIDDYVEIPHVNRFFVNQGTVSFWFKADDVTRMQGLFSKESAGYGGGGLMIYIDKNKVIGRLQDDKQNYYTSSKTILPGVWYHVAFTFGPGGMGLYLNGETPATNRYSGGLGLSLRSSGNFDPIVIGVAGWWSRKRLATPIRDPFKGVIDEVRFYARSLSRVEIVQQVKGRFNADFDSHGFIGFWKFDDDSGIIAEDFAPKADPEKEIDPHSEKAFDLLKRTVEERPETWKDALKIAYHFFPNDKILDKVLPSTDKSKKLVKIRIHAGKWLKTHRK